MPVISRTKGFELVVSGTPVKNKDFSWDVALNFGLNPAIKYLSLSDEVKIFYLGAGYKRSGTPVIEERKSYGDLLAFKWATDAKGNRVVTRDTVVNGCSKGENQF